jgi:inner membrane protein
MATFVSHPLFGAGAAYVVSRSQKGTRKFILLSTLCQWLPDIDALAYLFAISDSHPLGHRGAAHSLVFAGLVALVVLRLGYRQLQCSSRAWWPLYAWYFSMTALHGVFDAMVASSLGVAFFWPFDSMRYQLPWQPLVDVPIAVSALRGQFWYAQVVEFEFFGLLLTGVFVLLRLVVPQGQRQPTPLPTPMQPMAANPQHGA